VRSRRRCATVRRKKSGTRHCFGVGRKTRHRGGKAGPSRMPPSQETGGVSISNASCAQNDSLNFGTAFKLPREREPEDKNETSCAVVCIFHASWFFTSPNFKFNPRTIDCNNFRTRDGSQRRSYRRCANFCRGHFEERGCAAIDKRGGRVVFPK